MAWSWREQTSLFVIAVLVTTARSAWSQTNTPSHTTTRFEGKLLDTPSY